MINHFSRISSYFIWLHIGGQWEKEHHQTKTLPLPHCQKLYFHVTTFLQMCSKRLTSFNISSFLEGDYAWREWRWSALSIVSLTTEPASSPLTNLLYCPVKQWNTASLLVICLWLHWRVEKSVTSDIPTFMYQL